MDEESSAERVEFRNGPDQILPASSFKTSDADGAVQLYITEEGVTADQPISIHTMLKANAEEYPKHPALAVKKNGIWKYWTYKEYFDESRTVAKAFIRLGLERFHGVCIMGFNSPEWMLANFGAIFAGGICVGSYTTNSPKVCRHILDDCQAQLVVVENEVCLNKILAVKQFLPHIKWSGVPSAAGVLSWAELMAIGLAEKDTELNERLSLSAINQCCTVIFTSGTTGPPKGVMCSQDHMTWVAKQFMVNMPHLQTAYEVIVSYLPMSHLAAQMLDIYMACSFTGTVYFAQPDALKGTLLHTLIEVQPTSVLGVPRVWEKMYEKMQEAGASAGGIKKTLGSWAKYHGLNYYKALFNNRPLSWYESNANSLAKRVVLNKVKTALGLSRAHFLCSGAAPISKDVLEYFMSLDMPIMEGYGMSESLTICSMSLLQPGMFRLGSVGKSSADYKPGDGEILIKGRNVFMGYLNSPEKTDETLDDGWLSTGDIGCFDEDGFLYITGRIKELVVTAGGENIPPLLIENHIKKELPFISTTIVIGDCRKYLSVLLTLKAEVDKNTGEPLETLTPSCQTMMKSLGLNVKTVVDVLDELKRNPQGAVATAIQNGIERYNENHAASHAQKVQRWTVLPLDFSLVTGEYNNTLKLKRSFVMDKYKDIIDSMYPDPMKL
ncbi:Long-chain-fatty-acid--CoA ligase ACSBG2-like 2, partial [Homarus americanus]